MPDAFGVIPCCRGWETVSAKYPKASIRCFQVGSTNAYIFFYVTFSNGTGMNRHCTQKRQEESMPILKVGIVDWSTSVLDLHNYFHEKVSTFNKS